jgi:hypothetical protein
VRQALADCWDLDETIQDLALATLSRYILGHEFSETVAAQTDGSIDEELTRACRDDLTSFGVTAKRFFISDFAKAKVIAIAGEAAARVVPEEDEE